MSLAINGTDGIDFNLNSAQIKLGVNDDLQLYSDGSHSYIKDAGAGQLRITSDSNIWIEHGSENMIVCKGDGAVELYHDAILSLETTATGCEIKKEASNQNAELFLKSTNGGQAKIQLEAGGNQGGGVSRAARIDFVNTEVGTSPIWTLINDYDQNGTNDMRLMHGAEPAWVADHDGSVELFHDGSIKLYTESTGVCVQDSGTIQIKMKSDDGTVRGYYYADTNNYLGILDNTGNWRIRCTTSGYELYGTNHSDKDLKDNITAITGTSLDKITKLVPKSFNWKATDDGKIDTTQTYVGFIAQDVKEHLPDLVTGTDGNKDMGLDYRGLFSHAIKALTELSAEVDTLKTKVAALEAA